MVGREFIVKNNFLEFAFIFGSVIPAASGASGVIVDPSVVNAEAALFHFAFFDEFFNHEIHFQGGFGFAL